MSLVSPGKAAEHSSSFKDKEEVVRIFDVLVPVGFFESKGSIDAFGLAKWLV